MKGNISIQSKTEQMQVRVSPREKNLIRQAAKRANMNMSDWVLKKLLPDLQIRFQVLGAQLNDADHHRYALAALNDIFTSTSAGEFRLMIAEPLKIPLDDFNLNYLAAMIEFAAARKKVNPPSWVFNVVPLKTPYFGTDILNLRLYLLTHSPAVFRNRNIFIDSSLGDRV